VSIVDKALAKDPDDRYENAEAMRADLTATMDSFRSETVGKQNDDIENIPSIAVLPFVNMSPDPENAYFGDGLAEELISALTQIEGLRVAARTSAFRFRGEEVDIREIGQKLNVNTVLEGSVRKAGNKLRITAQLINIEDGYHLWSDRYDREMEDIFAIQDEIAGAIVKQLEVKLGRRKSGSIVKQYTDNLEAYSTYLKAQHHLFTLTPEGWQRSFELYEKAVELDPSFALPHVSLSQIYQSQCFWADVAPNDAMPRSRDAAERALELDENLAIAHNVLAVIHWSYDWDWVTAEREFKRAFELDPRGAFNYINHSLFLAARGCHDEAVAEARLAHRLDPLSSVIAAWETIPLAAAGLYDESIESLQNAIEMDPKHWQTYLHLGSAYLFASEVNKAVDACEKAVSLSGGASITISQLAATYYLAGRPAGGKELLATLIDRSKHMYIAPNFFARIHTARGDTDQVVKHMENAVGERDPWLVINNLAPPQIRPSGPEIDALLAQVGL
jgi:serine/threonine-protein kinase